MSLHQQLTFDRSTGVLNGASAAEQIAACAFKAGARVSSAFAYRGFAAGCTAVRPIVSRRDITVRLNDDALFAFPFGDGDWMLLLDRDYRYEPDMELFFAGIADADYSLIDCGANFGYWPVLVSSAPYGSQRAIALEPSSASFTRLSNNAKINGSRFRTFQRGVDAQPGMMQLANDGREKDGSFEHVPSIALDNLIDDNIVTSLGCYVVRLDFDNAAIAVIKGSEKLLKSECLVIYEEPGHDPDHTVSRFILGNTALKLFCYDPATGHFEHLRDASALDRIKVAKNTGYNVLATASVFWEQRIRSLAGKSSGTDFRVRA